MAYIHTTVARKQLLLTDHRRTFDDLCTWIDQHLDEPLGWQELMSQSGLDHLTLKALFHKFESRTPMTWIRQRREARLAPALPVPPTTRPSRLGTQRLLREPVPT